MSIILATPIFFLQMNAANISYSLEDKCQLSKTISLTTRKKENQQIQSMESQQLKVKAPLIVLTSLLIKEIYTAKELKINQTNLLIDIGN